jgi:energy-converting hydrogenase A subunit M
VGGSMTDETIKQIKLWKLESYSYVETVLKPLSKILDLSIDETKELLAKNLDMARIESSHSSAEQAKLFRTEKQIEIDLGMDYLQHLELLHDDKINSIKEEIIEKLESSGKLDFDLDSDEYKRLTEDAQAQILDLLKGEN